MLKRAVESINDTCFIWRQELKQMFKDEGVIIFFIVVPLLYPLLYSWIYNNEVVHVVPVVVVDDCHTALSRKFIRQCDASPDVKVLCYPDRRCGPHGLLLSEERHVRSCPAG